MMLFYTPLHADSRCCANVALRVKLCGRCHARGRLLFLPRALALVLKRCLLTWSTTTSTQSRRLQLFTPGPKSRSRPRRVKSVTGGRGDSPGWGLAYLGVCTFGKRATVGCWTEASRVACNARHHLSCVGCQRRWGMEGKRRVIGFRAIYSKRSPSGSLARARYIHQPYRGYTISLNPTLSAHVRILHTRDFETQFRGRGGTQTRPWVPNRPTACRQQELINLPARQLRHGCSPRTQREGKRLGGGSLSALSHQQDGHESAVGFFLLPIRV